MISGLAWTSVALDRAGRGQSAQRAAEAALGAWRFVRERAEATRGGSSRRLHATVQKGKPRFNAYLDDYAAMGAGALDLLRCVRLEAADGTALLQDAGGWTDAILDQFKDANGPGFFFTSEDHEPLLERPKAIFDSAIPSGTSLTLGTLAALAELDPEGRGTKYGEAVERQLSLFGPLMARQPQGFGELLSVALLASDGVVTVTGPAISAAHPRVFRKPGTSAKSWLVCHRKTCSLPISDPAALENELSRVLNS